MTKKFNRGFTLIELLVVIAIIGILSSVVLASLNTARNKGNDAAVKSNLNNIRAQAELVYDTLGNYDSVCIDGNVSKGVTAAGSAGGGAGVCNDTGTAWAAAAPTKSVAGYWCVDSTGTSAARVTALGAATVCPAS